MKRRNKEYLEDRKRIAKKLKVRERSVSVELDFNNDLQNKVKSGKECEDEAFDIDENN
jgi:hypothetical protein